MQQRLSITAFPPWTVPLGITATSPLVRKMMTILPAPADPVAPSWPTITSRGTVFTAQVRQITWRNASLSLAFSQSLAFSSPVYKEKCYNNCCYRIDGYGGYEIRCVNDMCMRCKINDDDSRCSIQNFQEVTSKFIVAFAVAFSVALTSLIIYRFNFRRRRYTQNCLIFCSLLGVVNCSPLRIIAKYCLILQNILSDKSSLYLCLGINWKRVHAECFQSAITKVIYNLTWAWKFIPGTLVNWNLKPSFTWLQSIRQTINQLLSTRKFINLWTFSNAFFNYLKNTIFIKKK